MKNAIHLSAMLGMLIGGVTLSALGQINVQSDGSDGALNITASNTVIDLSLASYGTWNQNNSTNTGNGVYDPAKWAVVFKYTSVNIASNSTVTFLNHPSHAPVVWLIQNNATIAGHLSLDGAYVDTNSPAYLLPTEPGPGGFRGGAYGAGGPGAGYGPGGGSYGSPSTGNDYGTGYGGPQVLPLLGGSGSGGNAGLLYYQGPGFTYGGPSGGGAILLAASGTTTINGSITSTGNGVYIGSYGGGYNDLSGAGAIRLVANNIQGNGTVTAGVVRAEANGISPQLVLNPNTVIVPPGTNAVIWPATNTPSVNVISVNGVSAPADPVAAVATSSDLNIGTNGAVSIVIQTQNFPPTGSIVVRVTPKYANYFNVNATYQSGTFSQATWKATTTLPTGFCVIQAHATSP